MVANDHHLPRVKDVGEVETLSCSKLATEVVALTALVFTPGCSSCTSILSFFLIMITKFVFTCR